MLVSDLTMASSAPAPEEDQAKAAPVEGIRTGSNYPQNPSQLHQLDMLIAHSSSDLEVSFNSEP